MAEYISPEWNKWSASKYEEDPEKLFAELEAIKSAVIKHNDEVYKEKCKLYDQLLLLANDVWGKNSDTVKYLRKKKPLSPSHPDYYYIRKRIEDHHKEKQDEERQKVAAIKKTELTTKAIAYLVERGKVIGSDFDVSNAVQIADEIYLEEYVANWRGWTDFAGDDSCDDCSGWDGNSRRCECGNRRVSWEMTGHFDNPRIYAEAW